MFSELALFQVKGLFERRLKGRDIAALQETIEEIGFRGDQEEEEDVFAIAEDNRRKRREAAEDADAVEEDEVPKSMATYLHITLRSQQEYSFVAKQICCSMQSRKREGDTEIVSFKYKSVKCGNKLNYIYLTCFQPVVQRCSHSHTHPTCSAQTGWNQFKVF